MRHRSWAMVKGAHRCCGRSRVGVGARRHGHPSPSLGAWWGAAHCPCVGGCSRSCVSVCTHRGRALLAVNGLVVGLVLVYVMRTVVVVCGLLSHSWLWAVACARLACDVACHTLSSWLVVVASGCRWWWVVAATGNGGDMAGVT